MLKTLESICFEYSLNFLKKILNVQFKHRFLKYFDIFTNNNIFVLL